MKRFLLPVSLLFVAFTVLAAVALLDMEIWRWMYDHEAATPAELREATLSIARDVWNRFFAPAFGIEDEELPEYRSLFGLYITPVVKIWRHFAGDSAPEQLRSELGEK